MTSLTCLQVVKAFSYLNYERINKNLGPRLPSFLFSLLDSDMFRRSVKKDSFWTVKMAKFRLLLDRAHSRLDWRHVDHGITFRSFGGTLDIQIDVGPTRCS